MADTPTHSLVPWVRRGLASLIAGAPANYYASLPVSLAVNGAAVNAPPIRLLGPGDVTSLDARAVIRTDPRDGADAFEPNYLAMVELSLPDLPWMLTPSAPVPANAAGRLKPWICLIVIPDTAGATISPRPDGPAILRLDAPLDPRAELPDLDQIDAWAHAQVMGDGALLDETAPNAATLSRLIAPRELEPGRRYNAMIVPTYRAGVHAGLGLAVDDHDLAPAWDATTTAPFSLPVYYRFSFQTGPGGDFASLARRIGPPKSPVVASTRPMDVSAPGFGAAAAPGLTLGLEGALRTVDSQETAWPPGAQAIYEGELRKALEPAPGADPVVSPPVYGRSQTGSDLPAPGAPPVWLGELNLDPRTRAAAGAGSQVVQRDQEAMVASAWDQLGEIRKANQLLRQAQLARQVSASIDQRHLDTVTGDGIYLQITAPLHSRVSLALGGTSATLRGHLQTSRVPAGAVSPVMRKLARPRGPIGRQLKVTGTPQLVDRLNLPAASGAQALVVAGPVQAPRGMVALDDVSPTIQVARMTTAVLRAAPGWQIATTSTTVATHAVEEAKLGTVQSSAIEEKSATTEHSATNKQSDAAKSSDTTAATTKKAALIDWASDPDVPELLKVARPNLPAPLVFPTEEKALVQVQENFRATSSAITGYLTATTAPAADPPPLGGSAALAPAREQLRARLDPEITMQARMRARIPLGSGPDPLQPLSAGPRFPQPMYAALAELAPDWMLPGISNVPLNAAALLETNPRFVEAFLVGLNEELGKELLWREFPAGRGGTAFQFFWGTGTPDIPPIATFDANGHLGDHTADHATGGRLVLLIRAELFRRYPNALVSAAPAVWNGAVRGLGDSRSWPVFRGEIGDDLTFFGFDVDAADARGADDPATGKPGWYFLIEEHASEPRFGLEPETSAAAAGSWNELRWNDVALDHGFLTPAPAAPAVPPPPREGVAWGASAAAMAFILMRKPVRVALHARALLGTEEA
jgi:hypothetical protein